MQPAEKHGQVLIFVIDETYDTEYADQSEQYRMNLEKEFESRFEETDIWPSASCPAFCTDIAVNGIPLWTVLIGGFFLGKPIKENLSAWIGIASEIRKFFKKPVVLGRHAAAVIAIDAVFKEMGGIPKSIRLLSYRPQFFDDFNESDKLSELDRSDEICEAVSIEYTGFVRHIFEIEADGEKFRIKVHNKDVEVIRIQ